MDKLLTEKARLIRQKHGLSDLIIAFENQVWTSRSASSGISDFEE